MSWSEEGWARKKGGPGVVAFATVSELLTASQGVLASGYYEVVGEWITYWDGATFAPELPETPPDQFSFYSVGFDFTDFDPDDDTTQAPNMFDDFALS